MEWHLCHPRGDVCSDMKGGVQMTDVETLNHGGADQVHVALAELINNAINQRGLAELYGPRMAVAGDRNAKGKFGIAKVRDVPVRAKFGLE